MGHFFIGQRVRLARPRKKRLAGLEGTIKAFGYWAKGSLQEVFEGDFRPLLEASDVIVKWDKATRDAWASLARIEPITDCYEVVSWESMKDL